MTSKAIDIGSVLQSSLTEPAKKYKTLFFSALPFLIISYVRILLALFMWSDYMPEVEVAYTAMLGAQVLLTLAEFYFVVRLSLTWTWQAVGLSPKLPGKDKASGLSFAKLFNKTTWHVVFADLLWCVLITLVLVPFMVATGYVREVSGNMYAYYGLWAIFGVIGAWLIVKGTLVITAIALRDYESFRKTWQRVKGHFWHPLGVIILLWFGLTVSQFAAERLPLAIAFALPVVEMFFYAAIGVSSALMYKAIVKK